METQLYDGQVRLKFSPGNHCYYANGKICQGVTSGLKELYPSDDLLEWYSSMASQDIVLGLAPPEWSEELKKAFLELYKGNEVFFTDVDVRHTLSVSKETLLDLYRTGKQAPLKRSQYGKDVGTQVHEAIERYHAANEAAGTDEAALYLQLESSGDEEQDKVALKSFKAYAEWFVKSGLEVVESEKMVYSIEQNFAGTLDRIYKTPEGGLIIGDFKTSNLSQKAPMGIRDSYWSQLGAYAKAYSEEHGVEFIDAVIVNSPKNGALKVGYASDMGLSAKDLVLIWEDDLKALRNHKWVRNQQKRLRSRI